MMVSNVVNMEIKGNFLVNGKLFTDWFNNNFKIVNAKLFPNFINPVNFDAVFQNLNNVTSLEEFCGNFVTIYHETSGSFFPFREKGGAAYCFNTVLPGGGNKHSYNQYPNRLAGNQLREWGVINRPDYIRLWNGQKYPYEAPIEIRVAALQCDFYKFRSWGFNQLTWRNSYEACFEPFLPKKMEDYSSEAFEDLLKDIKLASQVYQKYISINSSAEYAREQMCQKNFEPFANLFSGGWIWYVKNIFLPRCLTLYYALSQAYIQAIESFSIDGLGLTRQDVMHLQDIILHGQNKEAAQVILENGGINGVWSHSTEKAFRMLNIDIEKLLEKNISDEVDFDDLTMEQIKHIQNHIMYSGNQDVANFIINAGGVDGYLGENTMKAIKLYNQPISKLLQDSEHQVNTNELSKKQVVHIQQVILQSKHTKAIEFLKVSGGVDGFLGVYTIRALQVLNLSIKDALNEKVIS